MWPHCCSSLVVSSACSNVFWTDTTTAHSPLVGFMADGIPIYGPRGNNGAIPTDLDTCNGHDSDLAFYHYHTTTDAPYVVQCLKGCVSKWLGWLTLGKFTCKRASSKFYGSTGTYPLCSAHSNC